MKDKDTPKEVETAKITLKERLDKQIKERENLSSEIK